MTARRGRKIKKRNKRRNESDRKKEQNCKLGIFGRTSDFNILSRGT